MYLFLFLVSVFVMPVEIDRSEYISSEDVKNILSSDFEKVMDVESVAHVKITKFMSDYFSSVDLVTAHHYNVGDTYYYAVYGQSENGKEVVLLEANKELVEEGSYFSTSATYSLFRCRKGFPDREEPFFCDSRDCELQREACLGLVCDPCICVPALCEEEYPPK